MAVLMRAIVMLLILVGLPAAWVYYGPLPSSAQPVVDRVVELAREAVGWEQQPKLAKVMITAPRYKTDIAAESFLEQPTTSIAAGYPQSHEASQMTEQVEPLLERLRGWGVSQYRLEKWGDAGQMYRFFCAMPLAQSDEITRQFEAVADNPKASIEQVVGEVSTWQTARLGHQQLQ